MKKAFAQSCDVYFYRMGERVGIESIRKVAADYGWEEEAGLGIGPSKKGFVPTPEWERANVKGKDGAHWGDGDVRNAAIGQGYVLATPLQVARLYAAILNGGKLMKLDVVERLLASDGEEIRKFSSEIEREARIDPDDMALLRAAMIEVVASGTGVKLKRNFAIGAKTGTAQNPHGEDHAWMVAAWPLDGSGPPEIVAAALVVNGGHGSTAAGPVLAAVIDAWTKERKEQTGEKSGI